MRTRLSESDLGQGLGWIAGGKLLDGILGPSRCSRVEVWERKCGGKVWEVIGSASKASRSGGKLRRWRKTSERGEEMFSTTSVARRGTRDFEVRREEDSLRIKQRRTCDTNSKVFYYRRGRYLYVFLSLSKNVLEKEMGKARCFGRNVAEYYGTNPDSLISHREGGAGRRKRVEGDRTKQ